MKSFKYLQLALLAATMIACGSKKSSRSSASKPDVKAKTEVAADQLPPEDSTKGFFKAIGQERFWALNISADGISFLSNNSGESFSVPYAPSVNIPGGKRYISSIGKRSKKKEIEVTIYNKKCSDTIDWLDKSFDHAVTVTITQGKKKKPEVFQACGRYIADTDLNRVWTLAAIRSQKVKPNDFGKELPYIDLHSKINAFTGFGGCNRITGKIIYEGDVLRFIEIISTKMMCLQGNRESEFMKALASVKQYRIEGNMLFLFDDKEAVLTFKR